MTALITMGDKMESFYLTLRVASSAISDNKEGKPLQIDIQEAMYNVAGALYDLETHQCLENQGEGPDVLNEIVNDCCKKAAQTLRIVFAENVRIIIAENRKRLASKASLAIDAEASMNHAQRHINALIDLLGTWSNILMNINSLQLTGTCLSLIVAPLHLRIIEMAMDCFKQFKVDKRLDDWHRKMMLHVFSESSTETCSIIALDSLLSQIAAMREVVSRYYTFLNSIPLFSAVHDNSPSIDSKAALPNATLLSVVTRDERNLWRELDAVYVSLEHGYLVHTIKEALSQKGLLEVEANVFVPQATEDIFYLLQRIVERALVAGSESAALAMGSKAIELLDPASTEEAIIFMFLSDKRLFIHSHRNRQLMGSHGRGSAGDGEAPSTSSAAAADSASNDEPATLSILSLPASLTAESIQEKLTHAVGAEIAEELAAGATVIADVANGVNSWLSGISGRSGGAKSVVDIGHALQEHARVGSAVSSVDLLVAALEIETDGEGHRGSAREDSVVEFCLAPEDWGIFISGLAVAPTSIESLRKLYSVPVHGASRECIEGMAIIVQELSRVARCYADQVDNEARSFLTGLFEKHLQDKLATAIFAGYAIDGAEMEKRSGDSELVRAIHGFLGSGQTDGFLEAHVRPYFSTAAYGILLMQLAKLISETLLAAILAHCTFTEWGALLLHEEILGAIRAFEEAAELNLRSMRDAFTPLIWALKLLSVNQLADVRHYTVPAISGLDDPTARSLLMRRLDFPPDAVNKLKIKFEEIK